MERFMIKVMDHTASVQTIFIMFNDQSNTFKKEWPRSHRQNEWPRYHTLNDQDPTNKINDQDPIEWTMLLLDFVYKYNACISIIYINSHTRFLSFSYIPL